ncbi:MAG: CHASE domain-containing protein [Pyrinomonadaceae bacterium]
MQAGESNHNELRPGRYFVPYFVLVLSLVSTAFFAFYVWRTAEAKDSARFTTTAQELSSYVRGRPRLYIEVLRAGAGLFAISPSVSPSQFHNFVERLELKDQYPGAEGIGYLARVKGDQKEAYLAARRQQGLRDFQIWPEQEKDEYNPVVYFEPLDEHQHAIVGYDMSTEPARRTAMETARDTGLPAATARVLLKHEDEPNSEPGFLIYAPVYENDRTPTTVEERREALSGFVFSQFRAAEFIKAVMAIKNVTDVDVRLHDGLEATNENLFCDTAAESGAGETGTRPRLNAASVVDVASRSWTVVASSRPEFFAATNRNSVYHTASAGILVSLLLFGLTHSQVKSRASSERSAAELLASESKVRTTLTDRERAEEALRESEERYRELVENANDIVFTLDLDGNVTSINKAVENLTGFSRDELLKMNMSQFLSPGSFAAAQQMTARKLQGEQRTNYEVDVQAKHGRPVRLEISSRLAMKSGNPVGIQGVARDITARRRAEEALREVDQQALSAYEQLLERVSLLSQALGTARDLVTIFRALRDFALVSAPCDGLFVSLYDSIRDVRTACYGWGDHQEINISELPPMPITSTGPNSKAIRTGEVVVTDDYMTVTRPSSGIIVGPDNGLRPKSSLAAPMSVMGRIVGTIEIQSYAPAAYREEHVTAMRMAANLVAVAIENARLLEQESSARATAEESNRLKDEFLATVSHELRTPLTAILGWARMLQSDSLDEKTSANAIETIRRNAKAQSQIIDDILDVSRIITGKLPMDLNPLELAPVLAAAVDVVRPTAEAKGIGIETELPAHPMVVAGDSNRLQQVIWNLLSNAIKFTPSQGRVWLKAQERGSQVEIKVTDNGQGISEDFLPFVFDRFRQADSTTTRQHGGLGLGLAIARHLVEIHGGTIKASSDGAGKGSTFLLTLPRLGVGADLKRQESENDLGAVLLSEPRLNGIHVLLVDDDEDTLHLITAALAQGHAKVTAVSSAAAALEAIKLCVPDVLVSDIAMPGEDGYQLLERVRALNLGNGRPLAAVAITAYAQEEERLKALASGFQSYLAKPIELSDLIEAVEQAARRS